MTRVLVTGGSGFIGRHLIHALIARGYEVRATARSAEGIEAVRALGAEGASWNLTGDDHTDALLSGVGAVFHLACPRRVYDAARGSSHRPASEALTGGTGRLLDAFVTSPARRFVLTSSSAVYGKVWGRVDETAPLAPENAYARARVAAEAVAWDALAATPDRLVIVRLTETFGPGSASQRDILQKIARGEFRMIGDGSALHHLSMVSDVVAGLIACLETEAAGGAVMNIGSPARPFRTFVEHAAHAAGRPVRDTPYLIWPGTLALRAVRALPALRRLSPRAISYLDYQLRLRAFDTAKSQEILGEYATANFARSVAESLRAAVASEAPHA